jgi:cold shock CspA family protein
MIGHSLGMPHGSHFGFVRARGRDYFVNAADVGEPLRPGELVQFTPVESERGPRATHLKRLALDCGKCGTRLTTTTCECGWAVESDVTSWPPPPAVARKGTV